MVQQSIIILALFNEFVYEHRGNNTYVIQEKTALLSLAKFEINYAIQGANNQKLEDK